MNDADALHKFPGNKKASYDDEDEYRQLSSQHFSGEANGMVLKTLEKTANVMFIWFEDNETKANVRKCYLA